MGIFNGSCMLSVVFMVRYNGWATSEKAEMWVLHWQDCWRSRRRLHVHLVRYIRWLHLKITSRLTEFELRNHQSSSLLHGNQIHNHWIIWYNLLCWRIRPCRNRVAYIICISRLRYLWQRGARITCALSSRIHPLQAPFRSFLCFPTIDICFGQYSRQLES